jgi:hypothetical protein
MGVDSKHQSCSPGLNFPSNQEAADALLRAAKDGSLEKALLKAEPEPQGAQQTLENFTYSMMTFPK